MPVHVLDLGMLFSAESTIKINLLCNGVGNLFVTTLGVQSRRFVEPQGDSKSSPMRNIDDTAPPSLARKMADSASDVADVIHNLIMDVCDCYRPGLHYMRGPGFKWRTKHQTWLLDTEAVPPPEQHQPPPVYIRPCDAANPAR